MDIIRERILRKHNISLDSILTIFSKDCLQFNKDVTSTMSACTSKQFSEAENK